MLWGACNMLQGGAWNSPATRGRAEGAFSACGLKFGFQMLQEGVHGRNIAYPHNEKANLIIMRDA